MIRGTGEDEAFVDELDEVARDYENVTLGGI